MSSSSSSLFYNAARFLIPSILVVGGAMVFYRAHKVKVFMPNSEQVKGKVMVITGGTAGLGLESAKRLAAAGASVVLTSRSASKGAEAVAEVQAYLRERGVGNDKVYSVALDLDDLESVRGFPQRLVDDIPLDSATKIDVLMNNAGVMAIPNRQLTKDGYERTFQSNHLGHFLLTANLFERLAPDARIVNVASEGHKFCFRGLPVDDLNGDAYYGAMYTYGVSKLANILFAKELQRRIDDLGLSIKAFSLHPGAVQTDLSRNLLGGMDRLERLKVGKFSNPIEYLVIKLSSTLLRTVQQGASTQVYLASAPVKDIQEFGGQYFVDEKPKRLIAAARDMVVAKKLWEVSENLTKTKFL